MELGHGWVIPFRTCYAYVIIYPRHKLGAGCTNLCAGCGNLYLHYSGVIMNAMLSQITGVSIVHSTVCWTSDPRKHQRSASLAFVKGIHRWPVNSPHKGPVTRKMFPFDDVIMSKKIPRGVINLYIPSCNQSTVYYIFVKTKNDDIYTDSKIQWRIHIDWANSNFLIIWLRLNK